MKFAILINEGPFTHQASDSAYHFAQAVLARGHGIYRVFFYNDGVYNSNRLSQPRSDDRNPVALWSKLGTEHGIDLVVCVTSAQRRGMREAVLAAGFRISGFGQLVDAGVAADRLVTFGD